MRKILALVLCAVMVFGLCACNNTPNTEPTQNTDTAHKYSVGLDEAGYYIDFEKLAPKFDCDTTVKESDLVSFITDMIHANIGATVSFDDYLRMYANDFLSVLELDKKDIVELTDAVRVSLIFTDADGKDMPDYHQESQLYVVSEDADAIVSSFLSHKVGDVYSTEYTFPEDDEFYPNTTVNVEVTIEEVHYADALNSGVVQQHLPELNEVLTGVIDEESLLAALYPYLLAYYLQDYIEEVLILSDVTVPEEWIQYEKQRFDARLQSVELTQQEYMDSMHITEEGIIETCKQLARENMIAMGLFDDMFDVITEEDLVEAYGAENIEYYAMMQGRPYLKLRLMRTWVFAELAQNAVVLDNNDNPIDLSMCFQNEDNATPETEPPTEESSNAETNTTD